MGEKVGVNEGGGRRWILANVDCHDPFMGISGEEQQQFNGTAQVRYEPHAGPLDIGRQRNAIRR